ncbi:hypothetical protein BDP27DRAFT_1334679 [Rhodocollybia butyracea]|uniref:Uncharacterized protein n=1 Tax=Rhodocollybia butyracea TaxID=206335 RepID=A0A9P5PKF6_9AGAR|nr:hypothetical protein BDP27DRAFT_1334679 [Rhodocollybia butyracea]
MLFFLFIFPRCSIILFSLWLDMHDSLRSFCLSCTPAQSSPIICILHITRITTFLYVEANDPRLRPNNKHANTLEFPFQYT